MQEKFVYEDNNTKPTTKMNSWKRVLLRSEARAKILLC